MMPRLAGRSAIVTGAASGIGAAAARRLAADGAGVVIADVAVDTGEGVAAGIRAGGGTATFCAVDVSAPDDWSLALRAAREQAGPVDIVVSNAFSVVRGRATDVSVEDWNRQIAVSLTGLYLAARTCLPDLTERGGTLIATSSVHALFGLPGHPAYSAAKAGICALVRQLAVDYAPEVRVNAVLPGPIRTPVWDELDEAARASAARATALGRLGTADEVAAVIAFLASDDASFITGAGIVVDGGWSITKDSA